MPTTTNTGPRGAKPKTLRVIAYVRVSDTRDRTDNLQSPEVQFEKIQAEIERRGWRIVHERMDFVELDESGANLQRPKLMRAIELVERGEADVIAVYMMSRFARSTAAAALIERVEAAGGEVVSVSEPGLGGDTISGQFMRNIMLAVDQHQRELNRQHRINARERAIRENQHMGRVPTGYRTENPEYDAVRKRTVNRGKLVPDPVTAPVVTGIFERRANGESWGQICRWVRSQQLDGRVPSSPPSLRTMVQNRTYLGTLRHGEFVLEDAHEPLTDPLTFQRANAQKGERFAERGQKRVLSGLARCAGCRSSMQTNAGAKNRAAYYTCRNASTRPDVCAGPASIQAETLEAYVYESIRSEIRGRQGALVPQEKQEQVAHLRDTYRREEALLTEWESPEVQELMGDRWLPGLATRRENRDRSLRALMKAEEELIPTIAGFEPDYLVNHLGAGEMAFDEERQVLRHLIETIFVRQTTRRGPASRGGLEERVVILLAPFEVDLPRPGYRFDWRPFDW